MTDTVYYYIPTDKWFIREVFQADYIFNQTLYYVFTDKTANDNDKRILMLLNWHDVKAGSIPERGCYPRKEFEAMVM